MPTDDRDVAPEYWLRLLAQTDRVAHDVEARRVQEIELVGLRKRCSQLEAALVQARAAIEVRHELLADQAAALREKDQESGRLHEDLQRVESEAAGLRATVDQIVGSRRWRVAGAMSSAAAFPRRLFRRARGRA